MKRFLQIFGAIAVVLTLIPLVAADYWWIRIFDFLHIQLTLLTMTAIAAYFIRFDIKWFQDYIFMAILLACFTFQFIKIYPYTPIAPEEMGDSSSNAQEKIKLLAVNVLQENEKKEEMVEEINRLNPDIFVLTETNASWQRAIHKNFNNSYAYKVEIPLENTYGMLLYSKFELLNPEVKFLVDDSIPSIHSQMKLPQGDIIQLYAIHPTPPMPQHNPKSTDRDAEMMKIALSSLEREIPVIVTGDFNDVAWSSTTSLFQNVGRLLDPRVGRGFYNTFNANSVLLRWALDHLFTSEEFRVDKLSLGESSGSDHFPFYAELTFEPDKAKEQIPDEPTADQLERARKQIENEEEATEEENNNS